MPFIVDQVTTTLAAAASVVVPLPDHNEGDLLLVCATQDGGGTTIASTGWTNIGGQAASGASRQAWFYKVAGASESDPTFTGSNEQWITTAFSVRDFDATTPIDVSSRTDWNATNTAVAPTVTTTTADCLVFRSWGSDSPGGDERLTVVPSELLNDTKDRNECIHIIGHEVKETAGATGTKTAYSEVATMGGNAFTIAIRNSTGGGIDSYVAGGLSKLGWYGKFGTEHDGFTFESPSQIAASIAGTSTDTVATSVVTGTTGIDAWGYVGIISNSAIIDAWVGISHTITSANLSGKTFSLTWGWGSNSDLMSSEGPIVVFKDDTGNWVAYSLTKYTARLIDTLSHYQSTIALGNATEFASSGTMDWTKVVRVAYCWHRVSAATSNRQFHFKDAMISNPPIIVGGSAQKPCSPDVAATALNGWFSTPTYVAKLASVQGAKQVLTTTGVQIGNGTNKTYFDALGAAHELPLPRSVRRNRYLWNVGENALAVTIYASANDTIKFRSTVAATESKQKFEIHASSSTLATYDFAGAVIKGYEVTWRDGIACNDAGFIECYKITANGGTFDGCVVQGSLADIALTTSDPAEIKNCEFISGGAGHAIEITTPGTYTFSGNKFTGYGSAGTADAAIYNNSGGAVTLNVAGGGDTPTVKNGASASTTVSNAVTVTFRGVNAGSEIRVYSALAVELAGTETCIDDQALSFTDGIGTTARVVIVHPSYKIKEFDFTVPATSGDLPIQQELDKWFSDPA